MKKHPLAQIYTDKGKREHNTKLQLQLNQRKFLGFSATRYICLARLHTRAPWLLWTALPPTLHSVQDVAAVAGCGVAGLLQLWVARVAAVAAVAGCHSCRVAELPGCRSCPVAGVPLRSARLSLNLKCFCRSPVSQLEAFTCLSK